MSLHTFFENIKYTSAGNPSKKDVNRYLTFCILLAGEYDGTQFTINLKSNKDISMHLWKTMKASHYYTFEKISTATYSFLPSKALKHMLLCRDDSLCIKKQTIRFITTPLIEELFNRLHITSLRKIDKLFKKRGFSDTSCKVLKQVSFEFIPLHKAYCYEVVKNQNGLQLILNAYIAKKIPFVIKKMLKRKFRSFYPYIHYELKDTKLSIISDNLDSSFMLSILQTI